MSYTFKVKDMLHEETDEISPHIFVSENGKQVGSAVVCNNSGVGFYFRDIDVKSAYRRKGVGRAIFEFAKDYFAPLKFNRSEQNETELGEPFWDAVTASLNPKVLNRIEEIVMASSHKELNRYSLRPGKQFGKMFMKERYHVLELVGNTVYYKEVHSGKVRHEKVDILLFDWSRKGFVEITHIDEILEHVKNALNPFLAGALLSALITWLKPKLG